MAQGPPPSEAGGSNSHASPRLGPSAASSSSLPYTAPEHVQTAPYQYQNVLQGQPYALPSTQAQNVASAPASGYAYYSYPQTWTNSQWQAYSYKTGSSRSYPHTYPPAKRPKLDPAPAPAPSVVPQKRKPPTPSPSPPPPPPFHQEWDRIIKEFLASAGLTQALRGFESDMIIMSPDWERKGVPKALHTLREDLSKLKDDREDEVLSPKARPLDERKLSLVQFAPYIEPQTPTSVNKDISRFLAKNRARNDVSNRKEFLLSLTEKRRKLEEDVKDGNAKITTDDIPSCARTDAKTQDRDIQMKYDIAKNEDGPLRKTMKASTTANPSSIPSTEQSNQNDGVPTALRHPALDERLRNVETHLAVRYVPSPPRSLLDRLKFIEDHLIHLEKEFPPWAALHFKQPNRGWPPPPRLTPIIVPSHLTSTLAQDTTSHEGMSEAADPTSNEDVKGKGKGKANTRNKSSLHRAVMERLEVQKAIDDLAGMKTEEHDGQTRSIRGWRV
ncbi:hypothetical protein EUX98_g5802 [Antrodiella citrinella]|uniref:Uncharacterized protein n=1 Tax=Antrodiella citrinella TaxID=2447956 RepID=A0A4S4MQQ2_9APHY|nr:hypothetical protein EUX98_g5802 [Antrodiella citrinella]